MRRLLTALLTLLVASAYASPSPTQNTNSPNAPAQGGNTNARRAVKRGPVFRANKSGFLRRFELI